MHFKKVKTIYRELFTESWNRTKKWLKEVEEQAVEGAGGKILNNSKENQGKGKGKGKGNGKGKKGNNSGGAQLALPDRATTTAGASTETIQDLFQKGRGDEESPRLLRDQG